MSVVTEDDIKKQFKQGKIKEKSDYYAEGNNIITPSAISYLHEKNVTIHWKDRKEAVYSMKNGERELNTTGMDAEMDTKKEENTVYETLFGVLLKEKPEIMTHLRGNLLVFKDHPRIAFRGAIDSLEAEIIQVQLLAQKQEIPKLVEGLEEVITFIRHLLRCEVSGDPVGDFQLQSLSEAELRAHSHHPSQYYGMKHFLPTYKHGEMAAALNKLRTKARETEITAYKAFKDTYGQVFREDIIKSLNRLSSLFWIMMFRYLTDKYK